MYYNKLGNIPSQNGAVIRNVHLSSGPFKWSALSSVLSNKRTSLEKFYVVVDCFLFLFKKKILNANKLGFTSCFTFSQV